METRQQLKLAAEKEINVCIIRPYGYIHSEAFRDAAERVEAEAQRMGCRCQIRDNKIEIGKKNIIFGAHLNTEVIKSCKTEDILLVNLERLDEVEKQYGEGYLKLLDHFEYVDFCSGNNDSADRVGIRKPIYLYRPWHEKCWERVIQPWEKTWDVGFIGSITPRRKRLLEKLSEQGLKVKSVFGAYSAERDSIIGRCKVMLNIHAYDNQEDIEIWRLNYYSTNGLRIISEDSLFEVGEDEISNSIEQYKYADLQEAIISTVADESNQESKAKGLLLAKACRNHEIKWQEANKRFNDDQIDKKNNHPLTLNIGCGSKIDPDALNIDIKTNGEEDLILDISKSWEEISQWHSSKRHGELHLAESYFDYIEADNVFEHIVNLEQALKNIAKLLKPGGWLHVIFPHQMGAGAWQDPTHVRGMNENLFIYLNEWSEYLELGDNKLKLNWIKYTADQSPLKGAGYEQVTFVEALLKKEVVNNRDRDEGSINTDSMTRLGLVSIKEKICRRSFMTLNNESQKSNKKSELSINGDSHLNASNAKPTVSIITPTMGSRFKYLALAWQWVLAQDYSHEKMEWVIITDTDEEADYLKQDLKKLKNESIDVVVNSCSQKLYIGEKRNKCAEYATGDIIVNIDDDDYYFGNRVSHAVETLLKEPEAELAGAQNLPVYFLDDKSLWISDPGPNMACAGSFAFKKSLLEKTWFPRLAQNGEELGFTDGFNLRLVKLDPFKTMVAIAHKSNTFDKNRLRQAVKGQNIELTRLETTIEGGKYFYRVDTKKVKEESLWQSAYANLTNQDQYMNPLNSNINLEIFNNEPKNLMDRFADAALGKWLKS